MNKGLTHVKAGDPLEIRAPVWNKMLDAARANEAHQHSVSRTLGADLRGVPILIKNNSGSDLARYSILGITGMVFSTTDDGFHQRLVFTGGSPSASHAGKFAVLQEPVDYGAIGPACVDGVTHVEVDMGSASHKNAEVASATDALVSGETGSARILWVESGTGNGKKAVIRLGSDHPDQDCEYTPTADEEYIGIDGDNGDQIYHMAPTTTSKYCEIGDDGYGVISMYVKDGQSCKIAKGLRWNENGHACQWKDWDDNTWYSLPWTYVEPT